MKRIVQNVAVLTACLVLIIGGAAAFAPTFDIAHEHDAHEDTVTDVEYDEQFDIVWSLDTDGTFAAYDVTAEEVEFTFEFDDGHAIAVGDESVYIAAGDDLWEFDVPEGEFNELGTLAEHTEDMAYDPERSVVWTGGDGTVYAYDTVNGSEYMNYTEHSEGIGPIDVYGDYVVSGTTWDTEIVVYDVEADEVVVEPELPEDTGAITALNLLNEEDLLIGAGGDDANDLLGAYEISTDELHELHREHIFGIRYVDYEPRNDLVMSAAFDNTIRFFDPDTGDVVETYEHEDTIYAGSQDYPNGLLWFGDGEDRPGMVSALDIYYQEDPADDDADDVPVDDDADDADDAPVDDDADDTDDAPVDDDADDADDAPVDDDADDTDDADDDGLPGFGPLAALLAILGILMLHRVRRQ